MRPLVILEEAHLCREFVNACGPNMAQEPDITRLQWLSALLNEVDTNWGEMPIEDRDAFFTALRESQELLARLEAAMRKAEGR